MAKHVLLIVVFVLTVLLSACNGKEQGQLPDNPSESSSALVLPAAADNAVIKSPSEAGVQVQPESHIAQPVEQAPPENKSEIITDYYAVAWIDGSEVNLRTSPSTDADVLAVLSDKQEIELLTSDYGWCLVRTDGKEGYVFAEYISLEKAEQTITVPLVVPLTQTPATTPSPVGFTIAIDPGHQAKGNNEHEPIGPGSSETKPKVSSGTQGVSTKIPEYKLTLEISLKLRDELTARGYNVFMIRETHDVNISNRERAAMAADADADIFVRIHADGSSNSGVSGVLTLCPTKNNPFIPHLYAQSRSLSDTILKSMAEATGAKNRGVSEVDSMSGINWATMPVTIIEMGLMTNPHEDTMMQTEDYQQKLITGIADGIEQYFSTGQ